MLKDIWKTGSTKFGGKNQENPPVGNCKRCTARGITCLAGDGEAVPQSWLGKVEGETGVPYTLPPRVGPETRNWGSPLPSADCPVLLHTRAVKN